MDNKITEFKTMVRKAQASDARGDFKQADNYDAKAMQVLDHLVKEAQWYNPATWLQWGKEQLGNLFSPTNPQTGEKIQGGATGESSTKIQGFMELYNSAISDEEKQKLVNDYKNYFSSGEKQHLKQQLSGDPIIQSL